VKHLRIGLLLLLAVLLPVRGAMGAAMLCLPQAGVLDQAVSIEHHDEGMAAVMHDHDQHSHAVVAMTAPDDDAASAAPDDCHLCASSCTLTPLASAAIDLRHPQAKAALNPAPSVPAPSFISDGEERPPRTL
jgi:hypothetical protein